MKKQFTANIIRHEGIDGAYVIIPFDVYEVFGAKRVKVKASFDGFPYQGSIVRMDNCYLIGITKQIRKEINKSFGDMVLVEVEKDEDERLVEISSDFEIELFRNESALHYWNTLSFSKKKKFADLISGAKKAETRMERINKSIIMLSNNLCIK